MRLRFFVSFISSIVLMSTSPYGPLSDDSLAAGLGAASCVDVWAAGSVEKLEGDEERELIGAEGIDEYSPVDSGIGKL